METDTIYNIDCLEGMKQIPDGTIDAVICDLPYGTTRNQWDSVIPLDKLWAEYKRVTKPNAAIVLFSQQPFTSALAMSNPQMFRYEWIWEKNRPTGFLNANRTPLRTHENICIFYDKPPTYNPQGLIYKPKKVHRSKTGDNYGTFELNEYVSEYENYPTDLLQFNKDIDGFHPTQKPVNLIRYLVRTYTNEGDTVLDNCMGCGTTAIACIKERRHFIGFELNKEYYDKAMRRIRDEKRQPMLHFDFQ